MAIRNSERACQGGVNSSRGWGCRNSAKEGSDLCGIHQAKVERAAAKAAAAAATCTACGK